MTEMTIPVAAARGAILAETLRLPDGAMSKGRVLSCEDQALLRSAGINMVKIVAQNPA